MGILGPVHVTNAGGPVELTAPMQRAIIVYLALARSQTATSEQLIDAMWADAPSRAVNLVQQYISAPPAARWAPTPSATTGHGYQLVAEPDDVDATPRPTPRRGCPHPPRCRQPRHGRRPPGGCTPPVPR